MKYALALLATFPVMFLTGMACVLPVILNQAGGQATQTEQVPSRLVQVLFRDDFSNPNSGWNKVSDSLGTTEYADGGYRILVNQADWYLWSTPGVNFPDVIIEVEATRIAGPEENDFGAICRYKNESNFYKLVVGSDGYYGVSKVIDGKEQLVGMGKMGFDDTVIKRGIGETNRLRVECLGKRLTLIVNSQVLAEVDDVDLSTGDIGLIAGTYATPGVNILFDNLVVIKP